MGGGVSGAIHRAADVPALLDACLKSGSIRLNALQGMPLIRLQAIFRAKAVVHRRASLAWW